MHIRDNLFSYSVNTCIAFKFQPFVLLIHLVPYFFIFINSQEWRTKRPFNFVVCHVAIRQPLFWFNWSRARDHTGIQQYASNDRPVRRPVEISMIASECPPAVHFSERCYSNANKPTWLPAAYKCQLSTHKLMLCRGAWTAVLLFHRCIYLLWQRWYVRLHAKKKLFFCILSI